MRLSGKAWLIVPLIAFLTTTQIACADRSKLGITSTNLSILKNALDYYYLNHGYYPSQDDGLAALLLSVDGKPLLNDKTLLLDGWGNFFIYKKTLNKNIYLLYSIGENEIDEKGTGDDVVPSKCPTRGR